MSSSGLLEARAATRGRTFAARTARANAGPDDGESATRAARPPAVDLVAAGRDPVAFVRPVAPVEKPSPPPAAGAGPACTVPAGLPALLEDAVVALGATCLGGAAGSGAGTLGGSGTFTAGSSGTPLTGGTPSPFATFWGSTVTAPATVVAASAAQAPVSATPSAARRRRLSDRRSVTTVARVTV